MFDGYFLQCLQLVTYIHTYIHIHKHCNVLLGFHASYINEKDVIIH